MARQGKEGKDTGQLYISVCHVLSACVFVVRERKREEGGIRNTKEYIPCVMKELQEVPRLSLL